MPDKHAILSASSSHRWLECPPSALLCSTVGDTPSEFAMQGTDAHSLCEHKLKTALGQQSKDPTENLSFFDEEMADCSDMYAQYVMEQLAAAKEKGHSLGRPKADVPTDFIREYNKLINGEYGSMSKVQFAKMLDMGRSTVYKYITMLNDKATSQTF